MTPHEMQAATSFLLGMIHTGLYMTLENEESDSAKLRQLAELEIKMRTAIEALYYPSHDQE